jgi:hypothetical protein
VVEFESLWIGARGESYCEVVRLNIETEERLLCVCGGEVGGKVRYCRVTPSLLAFGEIYFAPGGLRY